MDDRVMERPPGEVATRGGALHRRAVLRGAGLGAAGLAAAALLGCGSKKKEEPKAAAPAPSGAAATPAANDPRYPRNPALPYPYNFPEPAGKTPKAGGVMRVAATWDVATMDPTKSAAGGTITIPNMTYNRLLWMKGGPDSNPLKLAVGPELAKSWERSPDGLTFTFKIQDGVKWQNIAPLNGRPFVAEDAAFAFRRYQKEGVHQSYWVNVDKIEAPDPATLKVTMKKPTPEFEVPLSSRYQTIFPKELVDDGSIDKKSIGTGPMILKEATPGAQAVFTKNPDYWRKKILLDGVEFKIMNDASSRLAAYRAKQFEYAYSPVTTKRELDDLLKTNPDIQVNMTPAVSGTAWLGMNLSNPKFADVRLRRALSLAVDRPTMAKVLFEGIGWEALPVIPWIFVLDKEPKPSELGPWVKFDIAQAKQLLQAAGVPNLELNYIYYNYSTLYDRVAEILVDQLRNAGITLKGGKVDYTQFNSQWVGGKGVPEFTTSGWSTVGFDANTFFYNQIQSKSPGNRWQLKDPKIDELAAAQAVEIDPQKRREIHKQIWDYELDQMYRPPMPAAAAFETYQPWLRGVRFGGILGSNSSYYDWGEQVETAWLDK